MSTPWMNRAVVLGHPWKYQSFLDTLTVKRKEKKKQEKKSQRKIPRGAKQQNFNVAIATTIGLERLSCCRLSSYLAFFGFPGKCKRQLIFQY